jgi:hypothetical protein
MLRSMNYDDIIRHYGSAAKAARKLPYGPTAIANWKARKAVPIPTQHVIQVLSRGKLRAEAP